MAADKPTLILKSHYYELQRDIQPQTLAVVMLRRGLLSQPEHATISGIASRDQAADKLIRTLAGKGKEELINFAECLSEDNSKEPHLLLGENLKKDLATLP